MTPKPSRQIDQAVKMGQFLILILGLILSAGATYATVHFRLGAVEEKASNIDQIRIDVAEIKADVKWLRERK